ncbi:unnamed protein product [Symbiodinium sp. CCMP2592]|nr:unnamed protein product [Symbiodinium sp. CCMP2592]
MARRPDDTRGSLIFQEGKCIEGDYYIVAVYDDPATCTISFSAYELENDCTYTYPLTYSQFDALFQYDSELMNPSNQDGRFHWVIERLDFVQDKRGQKVLCLGEEATAEVDDEADLVQEKPKATSAVPANVGGKIDGATRAKLLKELDTQDDAKLHAALVKSEGARKRFIAELHAKRNLEQLKASQRLQKADEDREARLAKLEQIKKQQHARAEAHRAAEEAKKSTMAQLEVLMKQKEAQAIRRLIQEKDAQDRGMGREKDAARQRRKMQERSAAEVRAIEEERAQQLAKKRDTEVEKRQGLILKKNRQIAEILRDEKLKDREYQVRLREEKDLIIQDVWKSKAQVRVAQEEKEREYIRLEEIREKVNVERERRRALDELKQISAIRKHAEEEKEVTVKRREKMRKEYLLQLKVEASNRAQAVREQARRNERREQKIQEREEVRLRKFRESQFMDTMRFRLLTEAILCGGRLFLVAVRGAILRKIVPGGALVFDMGSPIKIGLPGQLPSIDDGMDADLDDQKDSPSKRSRGPGKPRTDPGGAGSVADDVPLTLSSLRGLFAEQATTLLHAQRDQLHSALGDLEKRTTQHMQKIEAKVDNQHDQHHQLAQQVQAMAERVQALESRALHLTEYLDQQPFTTGPRRSVAMVNFHLRPSEREGDPRQRMMKVLQTVNAGKVQLEGAAKTLWCSFSRTPAERGRASVTALIKKTVMRHCPARQDDLDLDYATGCAWVRDDQVAGMGQPPDECRRARVVETKAGVAWVDVSTLAKWVDVEKSPINDPVGAIKSKCEGYSIFGWNIGGSELSLVPKAVRDGSGRPVEKSDLVLLQELPRDKPGWDYQQLQGRRVIAHRSPDQWRGTGLWFDDRAWCVLRKVATNRGTWFKLRHLEHQLETWIGTAHFQPGCNHATYEEDVSQHFGALPRNAHRVVFQGDVNTGLMWQVDAAGVTAYAKEGKGNTLHQHAVAKGLHFLPPGRDQLEIPTSRPRQENREGQCIDILLGKLSSCRGVRVCVDSFMCLGTDHELVVGSFAFPGEKVHHRHDSCPRILNKPIGQIDHLDQQVLTDLARTHTRPVQGCSYKDTKEVKLAFREAKRRGTAELWKTALKLRKSARQEWEKDRLRRASQGDWASFKALKPSRQAGWDVAYAEVQTVDPHESVHQLDRTALIDQLERKIGKGAELQCWKGLLATTRGHLQTPWGESVVEMNRGIKQGSIESPSFFGHITEVCLALAVNTEAWKAHQRVLEGKDEEEMLFVDDGLLWCRTCKGIEARVHALIAELKKFGLNLNPSKCHLYVKGVEDGDCVWIQGVRVSAAASMEIMGIKMYVGISIYELVAPLVARARTKFWEFKHIFRCRSGMKARVKVMERVVGSTALWCLASFMPDVAAMSLLNSTQLQLMVWLLRFAKRPEEPWDAYRQRAFRGARAALHSSGVERWSTTWLRRYWSYAGHRVRGMLATSPVISCLYEDFRTGPWWECEKKKKKGGYKHHQRYPRLSNMEKAMDKITGGPWREKAHDRKQWKTLENQWVKRMDLPWASGRQHSIKDHTV